MAIAQYNRNEILFVRDKDNVLRLKFREFHLNVWTFTTWN